MRLLRVPADLGRLAWRFINPSRTAGRVPLGRLAISVQIVAALIFVGYTLGKKAIRMPFSAAPYEIEVVFPDAKGLDRLDEPAAAVAGTPLGRLTDVRYENGHAVVTLTMEPEVRGKVFADASAAIRPASALQNLLVNINPGTPEKGPLPDGTPIQPERTTSYVAIDELTSILDADTQAYVSILLEEARTALHGREGELRHALAEVGRLTDTATPLSRALAQRRALLTRLVGHLDVIFTTLGRRGDQLASTIDAGNRTLAVTTARETELAAVTRELGPMLTEAQRSLAAVNDLTEPLLPALDKLVPGASLLAPNARRLRELLPRADALTDLFEELVRDGRRPLNLLVQGTEGLRKRARAQIPIMRGLTELTRRLDTYKEGGAQTSDTLSSALSVQDNGGGYGQVDVIRFEPLKPENFGLPAAAARSPNGGPSLLEREVARALELVCRRENPYACLVRFSIPGLPKRPVTARAGEER
jgi:phospholipid/cholesterol/gamma-HCH transport system substrate-binding protein